MRRILLSSATNMSNSGRSVSVTPNRPPVLPRPLQDSERSEEMRLVSAIAHGDVAAFDVFYERYVDRVYRVIYYQLGAQQADADDVLQETMMAAVQALPRFRGESRLFTWLCGIAYHKITDHRRQGGEHGQKIAIPLDDNVISTANENNQHAESTETRVMVRQALAELPEDYQHILLLKYVHGLSVDEIAVMTQRSFKSVESLLSRARTRLREVLERETAHDADG
jgi:RNA polymerase sigma factor (sigma-70 family)